MRKLERKIKEKFEELNDLATQMTSYELQLREHEIRQRHLHEDRVELLHSYAKAVNRKYEAKDRLEIDKKIRQMIELEHLKLELSQKADDIRAFQDLSEGLEKQEAKWMSLWEVFHSNIKPKFCYNDKTGHDLANEEDFSLWWHFQTLYTDLLTDIGSIGEDGENYDFSIDQKVDDIFNVWTRLEEEHARKEAEWQERLAKEREGMKGLDELDRETKEKEEGDEKGEEMINLDEVLMGWEKLERESALAKAPEKRDRSGRRFEPLTDLKRTFNAYYAEAERRKNKIETHRRKELQMSVEPLGENKEADESITHIKRPSHGRGMSYSSIKFGGDDIMASVPQNRKKKVAKELARRERRHSRSASRQSLASLTAPEGSASASAFGGMDMNRSRTGSPIHLHPRDITAPPSPVTPLIGGANDTLAPNFPDISLVTRQASSESNKSGGSAGGGSRRTSRREERRKRRSLSKSRSPGARGGDEEREKTPSDIKSLEERREERKKRRERRRSSAALVTQLVKKEPE